MSDQVYRERWEAPKKAIPHTFGLPECYETLEGLMDEIESEIPDREEGEASESEDLATAGTGPKAGPVPERERIADVVLKETRASAGPQVNPTAVGSSDEAGSVGALRVPVEAPEPVAWRATYSGVSRLYDYDPGVPRVDDWVVEPLYTHPSTVSPETHDEASDVCSEADADREDSDG